MITFGKYIHNIFIHLVCFSTSCRWAFSIKLHECIKNIFDIEIEKTTQNLIQKTLYSNMHVFISLLFQIRADWFYKPCTQNQHDIKHIHKIHIHHSYITVQNKMCEFNFHWNFDKNLIKNKITRENHQVMFEKSLNSICSQ